MNLEQILERHAQKPDTSVPDWMLGCFRRRCISFANGESDNRTIVYWFQSRNTTIDLRLPLPEQQVPPRALQDCSEEELQALAQYDGWEALSHWDGEQMQWHDNTSLHTHNRWPEPALLQRVGNCMVEFAPNGTYVEDWRLQSTSDGTLIGLRLLEQRNLSTGERVHAGGGLIIAGEHAALVLGRPSPLPTDRPFPEQVTDAQGDPSRLASLFCFETSVARGSLEKGFAIEHSTHPSRRGQALLPESDWEYLEGPQQLHQRFHIDGVLHDRRFAIDTLEADAAFPMNTPMPAKARSWLTGEAKHLTRYTRILE